MIIWDKFRGGCELVPGRELVHHHYIFDVYLSQLCFAMVEFTVGKQGIKSINKQCINLKEKIFPSYAKKVHNS